MARTTTYFKDGFAIEPQDYAINILTSIHEKMDKQYSDKIMRDYFAAAALQGFCANWEYLNRAKDVSHENAGGSAVVLAAYEFADEMLKARQS